jgi:hypothetical protein
MQKRGSERNGDFSPTVAREPRLFNSTVIRFTLPAQQPQGKTVVCSMVVHRVNEDSDDNCSGYNDVEDGISEWNPPR